MVRDALCVILAVCLLTPTFAVAQQPASPGGVREPQAPPLPPQQFLPPPSAEGPVRAPGGVSIVRPDPCFQLGIGSGALRVVPSPEYRLG
ncbi:MAG: hypothetical protein HY728_07560, partial [Candidatus Rokubacteria bacterium]|nr:hypothetical protein [Candidatus Rokubacteria bacterium]